MDTNQHLTQRFDDELENLRNHLILMGSLIETQVDHALQALLQQNKQCAKDVFRLSHEVKSLEARLDDMSVGTVALRQPVAGDLRFLIVAIKLVTDFVRISGEAEYIAAHAVGFTDNVARVSRLNADVSHLGEQVSTILHDALDAFVRLDAEKAAEVILNDRIIDDEFDKLSRQLLSRMQDDIRYVRYCLSVMRHARALERIGDHAKNVCEYVVYLVKGQDVRHSRRGNSSSRSSTPEP
jgi:phosphate transport system protein